MPTYVYACESCTEQFERKLSMDNHAQPESEPCPACGVSQVKQQLTTFSLGDPVRLGVKRPDAGFTEVLDRIKRKHPLSAMANNTSKYGRTGVV